MPVDRAEAAYAALHRTPFVSLYGSSNWHDDLAESVALFHLTEKLHQPYRIVVRDAERQVFSLEPTASRVRARFEQMVRFYKD